MKKNFTDFERSVKEGMEGFEMPFDQTEWQSMQRRMEGKKVSWNNTMAAAVVTALIFMSGLSYVLVKTDFLSNDNSDTKKTSTILEDFNNSLQAADKADKTEENKNEISPNITTENTPITQEKVENKEVFETNNSIKDDSNRSIVNSSKRSDNKTEISNDESGDSDDNQAVNDHRDTQPNSTLNNELSNNEEIVKDGANSSTAPFIKSSSQEVCAGEKIEFTVENITDEAKFLWNFGNADFSTDRTPVRVFDEPGEYNISLILSKSSKKIESKIVVLPQPFAKFTWKELEKGAIKLSNLSDKAASSEWKIGDEFSSSDINPVFNYSEEGKELVSLKVINEFGCVDSSIRYIALKAPMTISGPETIKFGDSFSPIVEGLSDELVTLSIHNLAGQMIYESTNGNKWNATMPDGNYAGPGSEFAWLVVVKNNKGITVSSTSGIVKIIP
ncbi:MAG: PKD domain-containing protein [Flavobacteriales bacterium]